MAVVQVQVERDRSIGVLADGIYAGALQAAANEIADRIATSLQNFEFKGQTSPRDKRGGPRFKDSIVVEQNGNNLSVTSTARHAAVLEVGSKGGYVILPTEPGGKLVFDNRVGYVSRRVDKAGRPRKLGPRAVVSSVPNHPGVQNPPKPFEKTMNAVSPAIFTILEVYVSRAFKAAQASGGGFALPGNISIGQFQTGARKGQAKFRGTGGRFVG